MTLQFFSSRLCRAVMESLEVTLIGTIKFTVPPVLQMSKAFSMKSAKVSVEPFCLPWTVLVQRKVFLRNFLSASEIFAP